MSTHSYSVLTLDGSFIAVYVAADGTLRLSVNGDSVGNISRSDVQALIDALTKALDASEDR